VEHIVGYQNYFVANNYFLQFCRSAHGVAAGMFALMPRNGFGNRLC
jgi:hypothetical protein